MSVGECFNTLKTFQKNNTPWNDRLTVEFYLVFWPIVGKHLIDYAHDHNELSNSQASCNYFVGKERQGQKVDEKLASNFPNINVDANIASKTLAKRLEPILPE